MSFHVQLDVYRRVGGVQDHQVFLQDKFQYGENQARGILLRQSPQDIRLRFGEGNHAQPQFQACQ